jgi:hypothetical protein
METPNNNSTCDTVFTLFECAKDVNFNIDLFVGTLSTFLRQKLWVNGWWDKVSNKTMYSPNLSTFITDKVPYGLGKSIPWVYAQIIGGMIDDVSLRTKMLFCAALKEEGLDAKQIYEEACIAFKEAEKEQSTKAIPPVGENIPTKNPTGINQHSRTTDILENISRPKSLDYGTSSAYRIAKLKRDCPEVADRLCKGEFKTVAEAERAAGVKPSPKDI